MPDPKRPARSHPGRVDLAGAASCAALLGLVSGCASAPPEPTFREIVSRHGVDASHVVDLLAPSPAMRAAAATLPVNGTPHEKLLALQAYLFAGEDAGGGSTRPFRFQYDARGTYDASAAFEKMSGNCVAFTSLFISMGRLMGVPVYPAIVRREKRSDREGSLIVVSSHVVAILSEGNRLRTYDFSADREGPLGLVRLLDDAELAAVALSNRAIGDLQADDAAAAARGLDIAARLAPSYPTLLGNLGVVKLRLGDAPGATALFDQALRLAPRDPALLYNRAMLELRDGRRAAALLILRRADESSAPAYLMTMRGDLELAQGDVDGALKSFGRAHRQAPDEVEPLVGLARAEGLKGRRAEARRHLEHALLLAPDDSAARGLLAAEP